MARNEEEDGWYNYNRQPLINIENNVIGLDKRWDRYAKG